MSRLRAYFSRLVGLFVGRRRATQLDEEIEGHLDLLTADYVHAGLSPGDARAAARRTFGGVAHVREMYRAQSGLPIVYGLARDVRIAVRALRRNRAFTTIATTTLGLGMGATVAMFSVLDQVVLRQIPYPNPDRLVRLQSPVPGVRSDAVWNLSTAQYFYFRQEAASLESVGIYIITSGTLGAVSNVTGSTAERALNGLVSSEVFDLLGVRPVLGRLFTEEDGRYDQRTESPPAVILSYDVWQRRFGGSANVIGQTLVFEDRAFPVVGVLGSGVELPETAFVPTGKIGIWMPLGLDPSAPAVNQHTFRGIARLRPGATVAVAQAELGALTTRLPEEFPRAYSRSFMAGSRFSTAVIPLRDDLLGPARRMIWLIAGAIGLVFIIASANVANLFLARSSARRRELTIRLALGGTRGHLFHHTIAESLLLCLAAALIGLALAYMALQSLVALAPINAPRFDAVRLDGVSIAAALVAAIVAAISFAAFATVRSEHEEPGGLRQQAPTASRRQHRMRNILVVTQVALALVLATGAALMARSVRHLMQVSPGFNADGVVVVQILLPRLRYASETQVAAYHRALAERLAVDPRVEGAGAATTTPLDGTDGCSAVFVEGKGNGPCIGIARVGPGYFEALRIAIRGRAPDWTETQGAAAGAVVSESLAHRLWPGEEAIGKGIRGQGDGPPYYRVVGVAADVRRDGFDRPPSDIAYFPLVSHKGAPLEGGAPRGLRLVIRTRAGDASLVMPAARSIIAGMDANVAIVSMATLSDLVAKSYANRSFTTSLLTMAAFLAMLLSMAGLYGVISYGVISRRNELGLRLALGARPGAVRMLVIRETLALVAVGLAIGLIGALASTRLLAGLLFGVSPHDPATLVSVGGLLFGVGLAAGFIPAWRAPRLDPVVALRCE